MMYEILDQLSIFIGRWPNISSADLSLQAQIPVTQFSGYNRLRNISIRFLGFSQLSFYLKPII